MPPFEDFVNTELPLRVAISSLPSATNFPRFTGVGRLVESRTPAQVLSDIGAAASSHTHVEADIIDLTHYEDFASDFASAIAVVKLDDLAAPDDNTDLNASASAHGLLPKLSGNSAQFLNGVGGWSTPSGGATDHGALTGLTDDDHTQYALLAGRSGGQIFTGGTAAGNTLTFMSTSHGTKGFILLGTSAYDEVNNRLGIGNQEPVAPLHVGVIADTLPTLPSTLALFENMTAGQDAYITIVSRDDRTTGIRFGDATSASVAGISYSHASNLMNFTRGGAVELVLSSAVYPGGTSGTKSLGQSANKWGTIFADLATTATANNPVIIASDQLLEFTAGFTGTFEDGVGQNVVVEKGMITSVS
jgi:hypothetical protein